MNNKLKLVSPKKARRYFARKLAFTTGPVELGRWLNEGANIQVVDVRAADDFTRGHIPDAVSLPKESWNKPRGLRKANVIVLYCYSQTCHLAAAAAFELATRGFSVIELEGGFETWKDRDMPIKKGAAGKARAKKSTRKHGRHAKSVAEPAQEAAPEPQAIAAADAPNPEPQQ